MRKKKSLLSLGILALILVLGVGYAVVNEVGLNIGGTANVGDAPINVDIHDVSFSTTGNATVENTWNECGDIEDTFTISNMSLNETATITYTIKNHETDVVATVAETGNVTNDNTEYFTVTRTNNFTELAAGATGTVTVEVTLNKTPLTEELGTATIGYILNATAKGNSTSSSGAGHGGNQPV